jgi:hypothetical protein
MVIGTDSILYNFFDITEILLKVALNTKTLNLLYAKTTNKGISRGGITRPTVSIELGHTNINNYDNISCCQ